MTIFVIAMGVAALFWIACSTQAKHPRIGTALLLLTGALISALLREFGLLP